MVGNNIYGSAKRQTAEQSGTRDSEMRWQVSVQNDAQVTDRIRLSGAASAHGFTVKYVAADGANVTDQVKDGTFTTPRLAGGGTYRLTVIVTVTDQARVSRGLKGNVTATSVLTPSRIDNVAFVAYRS